MDFNKQTHLISGFNQRRIRPTEAHTELCIEQGRDQLSLKKLRLIGLALRDQHRNLTHPLFGLGLLQALDTLLQPENGQGSFFIPHPLLKIREQTMSPLRQVILFFGESNSRLGRSGLNGTPTQGRLDLRQHAGFPCVDFLCRINGSEQDQAAQLAGGGIDGTCCG